MADCTMHASRVVAQRGNDGEQVTGGLAALCHIYACVRPHGDGWRRRQYSNITAPRTWAAERSERAGGRE